MSKLYLDYRVYFCWHEHLYDLIFLVTLHFLSVVKSNSCLHFLNSTAHKFPHRRAWQPLKNWIKNLHAGNIVTVASIVQLISESHKGNKVPIRKTNKTWTLNRVHRASDYRHKLLGTFVQVKELLAAHSITDQLYKECRVFFRCLCKGLVGNICAGISVR